MYKNLFFYIIYDFKYINNKNFGIPKKVYIV